MVHFTHTYHEWKTWFPVISNLTHCYLSPVYDELDQGDTTPEIIQTFVRQEGIGRSCDLLNELNEIIEDHLDQEIDLEKYFDEIGGEIMYDCDKLSVFDYFKFIRTHLIKAISELQVIPNRPANPEEIIKNYCERIQNKNN